MVSSDSEEGILSDSPQRARILLYNMMEGTGFSIQTVTVDKESILEDFAQLHLECIYRI